MQSPVTKSDLTTTHSNLTSEKCQIVNSLRGSSSQNDVPVIEENHRVCIGAKTSYKSSANSLLKQIDCILY